MGCYVNPPGGNNERWLELNGVRMRHPCPVAEDHLIVVLVDNGPFKAAGVAYSKAELEAFTEPGDFRPKEFFAVPIELLKQVSDVDRYLK